MNRKAWWRKIQRDYPEALGFAVNEFQLRHREHWRPAFSDPEALVRWFAGKRLRIETRKNSNDLYGYELFSPEARLQYGSFFKTREAALYDALETAFRLLEQRFRRQSNWQRKELWKRGRRIRPENREEVERTWWEQA